MPIQELFSEHALLKFDRVSREKNSYLLQLDEGNIAVEGRCSLSDGLAEGKCRVGSLQMSK